MTRFAQVFVFALAVGLAGNASGADDSFVKLLMKKADKAYDERVNPARAQEALQNLEKVLAVDVANVEARWKLGRVLYWIGCQEKSSSKQAEIFEKGIRYCQEAIKVDSNCVPCLFWLGVSYGKFGEAKGVMQSLGLVPHMQEALKKVKTLDEKYEWGGADRVLGRLFFKLPSIKGGDNKKAIEHLRKAVALGPKHLMNHRFLAEVLMAEGKKDEAKEVLKKIIETPASELLREKQPEMKEEQEEAKVLWLKEWPKFW